MGLRSRIRGRIEGLLGRRPTSAPDPAPPAPRAAAPTPAPPVPDASPVTPQASPAVPATDADEKAAQHLEKTRRAVLRFVDEAGGRSSLGEMHDYSEQRWFVGHRKFSDLMEGIVAEGLVDYDEAQGTATLTEAGRRYLLDNPPPKRR